MAQRLQELCIVLVEDVCGHLCAQVFSCLAENGRLSRPQLQQITRIPGRQLRHVLASLTQLHILLYNTNEDRETTFYQIDWRSTYALVRSSRIVELVGARYGENAGKIVANILQLGHARVGDLAEAFDLVADSDRPNGVEEEGHNLNGSRLINGADTALRPAAPRSRSLTINQFHSLVYNLLKIGFLVKVVKRAYTPAADLQGDLEEAVILDQFPDRKVNGPKKQLEFQTAVKSLKRRWREADEFSEQRDTTGSHAPTAAKRIKTSNGLRHGQADKLDGMGFRLTDDLVVRVNHAQCAIALRSHRLEELAKPYLGSVTAVVYGALLEVLEKKTRARDEKFIILQDDDEEEEALPVASTLEIADVIDGDLDLTASLKGASETYNLSTGGERKQKSKINSEFADLGIKQEYDSDSDDRNMNGYTTYQDRNKRLSLIEEHLKLLAEHSMSFCKRVGGGGHGEWRVHFPDLSDALVQAEVDATILTRFGKTHMRILRLLREKGKLEEKQVAAVSMMRLKDVRPALTEMQFDGLVECQEVPKDSTRQNNKTIFLWFHDQARVQGVLLQNTYQSMSRVLQRLQVERVRNATVIDRAEMMDLRHESLNQNEQQSLMQWRETEEKLLVQLQRMDDLVALLRDFSGKDTSLMS